MDLVERVQKELASEEKCIKISFSSFFIAILVFASMASAATDIIQQLWTVILEASHLFVSYFCYSQ